MCETSNIVKITIDISPFVIDVNKRIGVLPLDMNHY